VAGQNVTVELELRTSNKALRANSWFTDITNKFALTFSGEQLQYNITKGTLPGRYLINVVPTKATQANVIEFSIEGVSIFSSNIRLVVLPADINLMQLVGQSQNIPD